MGTKSVGFGGFFEALGPPAHCEGSKFTSGQKCLVIGRWRAAAVINAVIDDLTKDSEQRKKKVRMDERPARESADKAQPAAAKAGEADGPSSARFNRRGTKPNQNTKTPKPQNPVKLTKKILKILKKLL